MNSTAEPKIYRISEFATEEMFGDNFTTYTGLHDFIEFGESYRTGTIRWPGGSFAEGKNQKHSYHLLSDDLYEHSDGGTNGKGFSDVIGVALAHNHDISLILPTLATFKVAYERGEEERETALRKMVEQYSEFFNRLSTNDGFYDNALDGRITFTLELGNETAHLGWSNHIYNFDMNYGVIARTGLEWFSNQNKGSIDAQLAIQMGVNDGGARLIVQGITADGGQANLSAISSLVSHSGLVFKAEDFDFQQEQKILHVWEKGYLAAGYSHDDFSRVDLNMSEWSVGIHDIGRNVLDEQGRITDYEKLVRLGESDTGARQASGSIDLMSKMIALGYDRAGVWGTVSSENHLNSYIQSDGSLTHGGEVLRLMAESIPDSAIINVGAVGNNSWSASYFDDESGEGHGEVNRYEFDSSEKHTVFLAVTDIDGDISTSEGRLTKTFDFSHYGDVSKIAVTSVKTKFDKEGWEGFLSNPENAGSLEKMTDLQINSIRRLYEHPEVISYEAEVSKDGDFSYTFTDDFETVRLEMKKSGLKTQGLVYSRKPGDIFFATDSAEHFVGLHDGMSVNYELADEGLIFDLLYNKRNSGYASEDSFEDISRFGGSRFSDKMLGNHSVNVLSGGSGSDLIHGRGGNDRLNGQSGSDTIFGGMGNDQLSGNSGHDRLFGGLGRDRLIGGAGDDLLEGGAGADQLIGGPGVDIVSYLNSNAGLRVDMTYVRRNTGEAAGDKFRDIENLMGSRFNDKLYGDNSDNMIVGHLGDDLLVARGGNDIVVGGPGRNILMGGAGNDIVNGGGGRDVIHGQSGNDRLVGENGNDHLKGGVGNDTLIGGRGHDFASGDDGDDIFWGGEGNDTLKGGAGNDRVLGAEGDDWLYGGDDHDILSGSAGVDRLYGGQGRDIFVFRSGAELDVVKDFEDDVDRIFISRNETGGLTDPRAVIDRFAVVYDGSTVFDFNDDDRLIVKNMSNPYDLVDDMLIT